MRMQKNQGEAVFGRFASLIVVMIIFGFSAAEAKITQQASVKRSTSTPQKKSIAKSAAKPNQKHAEKHVARVSSKISNVRKVAKKKSGPSASELAIKKIESESTVLWDTSYTRPQIVDAPAFRRPASIAPVARTVSVDFTQTEISGAKREAANVATPAKVMTTESQSVVYAEK
jgi:hypothetical protein